MHTALPVAVGILSFAATVGVVGTQVVLATHISTTSPVRITSILSTTLQFILLLLLVWLWLGLLSDSARVKSRKCLGIALGMGILGCTVGAAVPIASVILLSKEPEDKRVVMLGTSRTGFVVGSAVVLAVAFALQLLFLVLHFLATRLNDSQALDSGEKRVRATKSPVKSIPYSQTNISIEASHDMESPPSRSPPSSLGRKSMVETTTASGRSSFSNVVRPSSSRTKLLPSSEKRRPPSLESVQRSSAEETFDSWDTSSVDAHNRQAVLEASSPPPHKMSFLETIPASPTVSRSPSPGSPLDLDPPVRPRRSRSYSPATRKRAQTLTPKTSNSEMHIHPLFRSDSPTPPPVATPGTSVVASPSAGQVLSPQQSAWSLRRMRSGSLPPAPSPLSRQGSFEDMASKKQRDEQKSLRGVDEEDNPSQDGNGEERQLTPPIPDWILSAASRTSLTGYKTRQTKPDDDP